MGRSLSRLWLWYLPAAAGILIALLFAAGFGLALRGLLGEPLGNPPAVPARTPAVERPRSGRRLLLVLGDSLARGTGDETGKGYAGYLVETLRKSGPVSVANLAVNGWESGDVRALLETENARDIAARADWILLSAGGNDLSHAVPRTPGAAADALGRMGNSRDSFATALREILRRLREANPKAPIYVLGLYDPFAEETRAGRVGASVILSWNVLIEETALSFPGVFVVPTFDLLYGRPDRLAADHFHPNRRGHEAIAARFAQLLPETP